jgi:hypothetical protein
MLPHLGESFKVFEDLKIVVHSAANGAYTYGPASTVLQASHGYLRTSGSHTRKIGALGLTVVSKRASAMF